MESTTTMPTPKNEGRNQNQPSSLSSARPRNNKSPNDTLGSADGDSAKVQVASSSSSSLSSSSSSSLAVSSTLNETNTNNNKNNKSNIYGRRPSRRSTRQKITAANANANNATAALKPAASTATAAKNSNLDFEPTKITLDRGPRRESWNHATDWDEMGGMFRNSGSLSNASQTSLYHVLDELEEEDDKLCHNDDEDDWSPNGSNGELGVLTEDMPNGSQRSLHEILFDNDRKRHGHVAAGGFNNNDASLGSITTSAVVDNNNSSDNSMGNMMDGSARSASNVNMDTSNRSTDTRATAGQTTATATGQSGTASVAQSLSQSRRTSSRRIRPRRGTQESGGGALSRSFRRSVQTTLERDEGQHCFKNKGIGGDLRSSLTSNTDNSMDDLEQKLMLFNDLLLDDSSGSDSGQVKGSR
mmetsp:Transcript_36061/g.75801  ORF Transcript_36061/g.75801 Transcript_36061/m.75801 type:complete len:415 (-) Transcript_36061:156-1400(-)